jgi:DNA-3-methyladenine glycosylase II
VPDSAPDSTTAYDHLRTDPTLGPLVEDHGPVTVEPAEDLFERFVVSVVRQQVSMDAAAAIRERLFDAAEITPSGVLAADAATMREAGLSEAKVEYVTAAAHRFRDRSYDHDYFAGMDDEAVAAELTDIRGVGPWTAKMFLLFCLGRPDVFPVEDLGIRNAMHERFDDGLTRAEMRERAQAWRPYRSYASKYLWRVID